MYKIEHAHFLGKDKQGFHYSGTAISLTKRPVGRKLQNIEFFVVVIIIIIIIM
jgi:hypothetical protein